MKFSATDILALAVMAMVSGPGVMAYPASYESLPQHSERSEDSAVLYSDIESRTSITVRAGVVTSVAITVNAAAAFASFMATYIKAESNSNLCDVISGSVDGVSYQYAATSSGSKCDTTAEVKTINSAVTRALEWMQKEKAGQACFRLTHGGTWTGHLQLAGDGVRLTSGACDRANFSFEI